MRVRVAVGVVTMVFFLLISPTILAQQSRGTHVRHSVISDWTHHHLLYPDSTNPFRRAHVQNQPRWAQNWYLHHQGDWWPGYRQRNRHPFRKQKGSRRDWSVPLGTANFGPLFDFTFVLGSDTGYVSLNTTDQGDGSFLATAGALAFDASSTNTGTYPLVPGGPTVTTSKLGSFIFDDLLFSTSDPVLDNNGLLFANNGLEVNMWGNGPGNYSLYTSNAGGSYPSKFDGPGVINPRIAPGGGQNYPAKFVFDVSANPSCTNDFVALGIATNAAAGGQANIVGFNNLYSAPGGTGLCAGTGPTLMFAYASGSGQVPASVVLSQTGQQLAYVENLSSGSSYFHVLTIGTTGNNGSSATSAAVPGIGNNALDTTVLLSPDGGITTQRSTGSAFVVYTDSDSNDVAYVTTYSVAGTGSGYLYKIGNVFNGTATPSIIWSVPIAAVPSAPVYDSVSNKIFFTDSSGRIDYVVDSGLTPSVVYGTVLAGASTSQNPVVIDSTSQMVYASFNSDGTNAIVVQTPTDMSSAVSVPVGPANTTYAGPYLPDFNNAWYSGVGTPLMYIAGTGTGGVPTLYSVGFGANGVMNINISASSALTTGVADSSSVTEFFNSSLGKDFLFVGVTNHCIATANGGAAGCVMSFDITNGFPIVDASSTALPAAGGTTGIVVDNGNSAAETSSIYYATKSGSTLVKATQIGLN